MKRYAVVLGALLAVLVPGVAAAHIGQSRLFTYEISPGSALTGFYAVKLTNGAWPDR